MAFAYYQRLTPAQQRLYRASDALLHELCHHLDYELLRFPDSMHTEGVYKRESSLFGRLMREELPPPGPRRGGLRRGRRRREAGEGRGRCHGVEGRRRRWLR